MLQTLKNISYERFGSNLRQALANNKMSDEEFGRYVFDRLYFANDKKVLAARKEIVERMCGTTIKEMADKSRRTDLNASEIS